MILSSEWHLLPLGYVPCLLRECDFERFHRLGRTARFGVQIVSIIGVK